MAASFDTTRRPGATGLSALLDFAVASHARALALLVAVAVLAFVPGFGQIPPLDRDEARIALTTKLMIERGSYAEIRLPDDTLDPEPPGIHWLQAAAVKFAEAVKMPRARTTIWLYRLPSLVGAVGAVLLTYWAALAFVSRRAAVLAGIMMATSLLVEVEARLAKADAMLLLLSLAALGALARIYLRDSVQRPWLLPAIFWTAIGFGVLLKGPLTLVIPGLGILTLAIVDRSRGWWRRLEPGFGLAVLILSVLPWLIAALIAGEGGFIFRSITGDILFRLGLGQTGHGTPPGYHFAFFWLSFFPGSILVGLAARAVWNVRREPGARLLLAWLLPSWVAFELVIVKLPDDVLPLYPALAILAAGVLDHHGLSRQPWLIRSTAWWLIITILLFAAALAGHIVIGEQAGVASWPFGIAACILALFAWWLYTVDGPEESFLRAATASVLASIALFGATVPAIPELFPSASLARAVRSSGCAAPAAATAGFYEPSIIFLMGATTVMTDGAGAAEFLSGDTCRFAFVDSRFERAFAQRAEAIGLRYFAGPRFEALNVNAGRRISLVIFHSDLGR
jgi:4-amino-4-deoxy-L-arabinose transferase-like glycosyltransferase